MSMVLEHKTRVEQQEYIHRQLAHGAIIAEFFKPMMYSIEDSGKQTVTWN